MYNICYKRILCCWILFAFSVLMGLLFSGLNGIALFSLGVAWLFLNASAIFLCMWMKLRLSRGLERCMASVNKQLLRHKILLVLDDRGKISCHKVNLCFMYFEPAQCVTYLNEFIARNEQSGTAIEAGWEARLDVPSDDIVIQGSNNTRVSRKQVRIKYILLISVKNFKRNGALNLYTLSLPYTGYISCAFFLFLSLSFSTCLSVLASPSSFLVRYMLHKPIYRPVVKSCFCGTPSAGAKSTYAVGSTGSSRRMACTKRHAIYNPVCVRVSLPNRFCTINRVVIRERVVRRAMIG